MAIFNSYVKLPEGNLLVLEYLRSPAKNVYLAGDLRLAMCHGILHRGLICSIHEQGLFHGVAEPVMFCFLIGKKTISGILGNICCFLGPS
jgi:hypothetical protein